MSSSALPSSGRSRRTDLRGRPRRPRRLGGRQSAARGRVHEHPHRHRAGSSTCATSRRCRTGSRPTARSTCILVAGTVGGILANSTRPAEFIYDNMMIHGTVVHAAHEYDVHEAAVSRARRASTRARPPSRSPRTSCSPARWSRPTSGTRSPRSPASSCARPTARQYGCDFISAMPTNLYGPNDNFDLTSSHVLPALIRKFHDARALGRPRRSRSGAPVRRCASSSTSTTSPTRACS